MPTDAELLSQYCRSNDAAAFSELSRRYRDMVFASAQRITGDRHDAEDVAQTCFLELARKPWSIRTSLAAYLHWAATSRARNLIRDRARRRNYEQQAATERAAQAKRQEPKEQAWEFLAPEVDSSIETLPEDLRVPVILFYLRGLNEQEIAAELGINSKTVGRRLQVGVRRLRATLAKSGVPVTAAVLTLGLKAGRATAAPSSLTATLGRMALVGTGGATHAMPRASETGLRWLPRGGAVAAGAGLIACLGVGSAIWAAHSYWRSPLPSPYDRLSGVYQPYLGQNFPQRIAALCQDQDTFWRGSQLLFFDWCKDNAADWLADRRNVVISAASPYLPDARALPLEIDTANSARLPFQIELLQALVAMRIERGLIHDPIRFQMDREVVGAYRLSLSRLTGKPSISRDVEESGTEYRRFVAPDGSLRSIVLSSKGKIAEIVRPVRGLAPLQTALMEALRNNPKLCETFPVQDEAWIINHVVAAGQRMRVKSVASQGLTSILVLIGTPAAGQLLELHEVTPSAAELSHAIDFDIRPPGRRAAEDETAIARQSPPTSWCTFDGKSMVVRPHDMPADLDPRMKSSVALDWAVGTGTAHRGQADAAAIGAAITPEMIAELSARADACTAYLLNDFDTLLNDPRSQADRQSAEQNVIDMMSNGFTRMNLK